MSVPTDDGAPDEESTGAGAADAPDPASSIFGSLTAIGDLDGGVAVRLTRRCRIAAITGALVAAALLAIGAIRPWDALSALLALLAGAAVVVAAVSLRRAVLWSAVSAAAVPDDAPLPAVIGPPRSLSPDRPGAPLRRKLGAVVVPIHTDGAPPPGRGALVVHARADGVHLKDADSVGIWRLGQVGRTRDAVSGASTSAGWSAGRFVLHRAVDGVVFLGTTHLTDAW